MKNKNTNTYLDYQVHYHYHEKPTTTNTVIRKESAISENPKIQCLSDDRVRRLHNTKGDIHRKTKTEIVDSYTKSLLTSVYCQEPTKRIQAKN